MVVAIIKYPAVRIPSRRVLPDSPPGPLRHQVPPPDPQVGFPSSSAVFPLGSPLDPSGTEFSLLDPLFDFPTCVPGLACQPPAPAHLLAPTGSTPTFGFPPLRLPRGFGAVRHLPGHLSSRRSWIVSAWRLHASYVRLPHRLFVLHLPPAARDPSTTNRRTLVPPRTNCDRRSQAPEPLTRTHSAIILPHAPRLLSPSPSPLFPAINSFTSIPALVLWFSARVLSPKTVTQTLQGRDDWLQLNER
ncbi:uncharacterized protein LOC127530654 [Acanthochromis polyacanthus]|uniref:uncharacterized protein LOC127530654 n=1 Tax=Acanthochromis polyacanthus TaxID=80966 RepID=UPI0022344530|nr:uncharacterized protein LOC127530654 [Acanthochromis polyacanthus]